ncbi:MAG: hypothetical protein WA860_06435 [Acidimicrobiales bacterium]
MSERRPCQCDDTAPRTSMPLPSGVFLDPDGHPWEVAHNPDLPIADDGSVRLH